MLMTKINVYYLWNYGKTKLCVCHVIVLKFWKDRPKEWFWWQLDGDQAKSARLKCLFFSNMRRWIQTGEYSLWNMSIFILIYIHFLYRSNKGIRNTGRCAAKLWGRQMLFYHSHAFGCVLAIFKISGHAHHICIFRVLNRFVPVCYSAC
jgi:hypothetical protein